MMLPRRIATPTVSAHGSGFMRTISLPRHTQPTYCKGLRLPSFGMECSPFRSPVIPRAVWRSCLKMPTCFLAIHLPGASNVEISRPSVTRVGIRGRNRGKRWNGLRAIVSSGSWPGMAQGFAFSRTRCAGDCWYWPDQGLDGSYSFPNAHSDAADRLAIKLAPVYQATDRRASLRHGPSADANRAAKAASKKDASRVDISDRAALR